MTQKINLLIPTYFKIGYLGIGKYNSSKKFRNCFQIWRSILERCYSDDIKYHTYVDCTVDEKWHNFQNFAEWYFNNHVIDFQLSKNILFKNNKIYSEETCCFVPQQIVLLFNNSKNKKSDECPVGVSINKKKYLAKICIKNKIVNLGTFDTIEKAFNTYKTYKEGYIKLLAFNWEYKITEKVFNALNNYVVEITD